MPNMQSASHLAALSVSLGIPYCKVYISYISSNISLMIKTLPESWPPHVHFSKISNTYAKHIEGCAVAPGDWLVQNVELSKDFTCANLLMDSSDVPPLTGTPHRHHNELTTRRSRPRHEQHTNKGWRSDLMPSWASGTPWQDIHNTRVPHHGGEAVIGPTSHSTHTACNEPRKENAHSAPHIMVMEHLGCTNHTPHIQSTTSDCFARKTQVTAVCVQ